jgi:tetratricopeptide (TPR) repeat protein
VAVVEARQRLERDPASRAARFGLADALLATGCNSAAVRVLRATPPEPEGDPELQRRLRDALSLVDEQRYIDNLGEAAEAAQLQRLLLRCSRLSDRLACDEALAKAPRDPAVHGAAADARLAQGEVGDAVTLLRRARQLLPQDAGLRSRLQQVEMRRQSLVTECLANPAPAALSACEQALLPGEPDELAVRRRTGQRLQLLDEPGRALDAFLAAQRLDRDDPAIAGAIVSLRVRLAQAQRLATSAPPLPPPATRAPLVRRDEPARPASRPARRYSNQEAPTRSH